MFNELTCLSTVGKSRLLGRTFLQISFFFLLVTQICFAQWYSQNSGTTKNLNAVQFIDANNGFAVGDSGMILHTSDAGINWTTQMSGTSLPLRDVDFVSALQGWAVGGRTDEWQDYLGGDSSVILFTSNGGVSWVKEENGTGHSCFFDICFTDANNGVVVGEDTSAQSLLMRTTDGGLSWFPQTPLPNAIVSSSVHFNDDNIGWITGIARGGSYRVGSRIETTTDGGLSWELQFEMGGRIDQRILNRIKFSNENNGFAVGWSAGPPKLSTVIEKENASPSWAWGEMFFSTDGGTSWIGADTSSFPRFLGLRHSLNDVFLIGADAAIVVGDSGYILRATYAAGGWTQQTSSTDSCLNGVYFVDNLTGWVVGDGGTILHTTHGGVVPVELNSFTASANCKEITLSWLTATELNNQGFEVQRKFGSNAFVTIGSVKGHGTTTSPNNYTYVDKLLSSGKYFYRLKQIDFGGKYEYSQTVEVNWSSFTTYKLEQNYPNPFNPNTKISWQSPVSSMQTIKVFDVLGTEVATLVNEEKEAGSYEVEFDASKLSSGVYFYQLKAGSFVQTRKMILLR